MSVPGIAIHCRGANCLPSSVERTADRRAIGLAARNCSVGIKQKHQQTILERRRHIVTGCSGGGQCGKSWRIGMPRLLGGFWHQASEGLPAWPTDTRVAGKQG
jgi:hypothetical protein